MLATDETAVICDFAQTYGITDFRSLPVYTAAALAAGFRNDSRIRMKMRGQKYSDDVLLLAIVADRLGILAWQQTEDGHKGRNQPPSIYQQLAKKEQEPDSEVFGSPEEYWIARRKIEKEAVRDV